VAVIPKVLHEHINTAYPQFVCQIGTVLPNGFAQITMRGSTAVFDDEHFSLWERGRGSTNASLTDGTKVTIFFRKPPLRESGLGQALQVGRGLRRNLEPPDRAGKEGRPRQEGLRRAHQGGAGRGPLGQSARDLTSKRPFARPGRSR
jgi:hypothetical protein